MNRNYQNKTNKQVVTGVFIIIVSLDKVRENSGLTNFKYTPYKIKTSLTFKFCELNVSNFDYRMPGKAIKP